AAFQWTLILPIVNLLVIFEVLFIAVESFKELFRVLSKLFLRKVHINFDLFEGLVKHSQCHSLVLASCQSSILSGCTSLCVHSNPAFVINFDVFFGWFLQLWVLKRA